MRRSQSSKSLWRRRTRATVLSTFRTVATPCPTRTRSEPSYVWELVEGEKQGHPQPLYAYTCYRWALIWEQKDCLCYKTPDGKPFKQWDTCTKGSGLRETWSALLYPGPG